MERNSPATTRTEEMVILSRRDHPATVTTPRQVRAEIRELFGTDPPVEEILLASDELVTNAIEHSGSTGLTVTLATGRHTVRIAVTDAGPANGVPRLTNADPAAEHGRGLMIVQALSTDWGIEQAVSGTTVWCHIPLPIMTSNQPGQINCNEPEM
jgi:anti-sigma regulatory factor (Ser/Thr protein kinase)